MHLECNPSRAFNPYMYIQSMYLRRIFARPIRTQTPAQSAPKSRHDAAVAATVERSGREDRLYGHRLPIRGSRPEDRYIS